MSGAGIVSYGGYVPNYRIRTSEIARVWGDDPDAVESGLRVESKSVPDDDEDTATISVEATRRALGSGPVGGDEVGAVYVGSESHPYAVKPTATIVGAAVGATPLMTAADLEFACKAGTAGIQAGLGLVESDAVDYSLAVGADVAQGAPGDSLEYSASAGGAAFVLGDEDAVAEIEETVSYTSDTPDFWRREGERYPQHGERFTGKPAYFKHTEGAAHELFEATGREADDYDYAVFHQPNGKFPARVAESLGFDEGQYGVGLLSPEIGNTYSGASLVGLVAVLDEAEPGDRVMLVSFGSGAGSDAFSLRAREGIEDRRTGFVETLEGAEYVDYAEYAKRKGKIVEE